MSSVTLPLMDVICMQHLGDFAISGEDLRTCQDVQRTVATFSQRLGLPEEQVVLSNAVGWSALGNLFPIPTICFSDATRAQIYQLWKEKNRRPIDEAFIQQIIGTASSERDVHMSLTESERNMLIGHELGHAWLSHSFKAFPSPTLEIDGKTVVELKHDQALEDICDFIGVHLTDPESGIAALQKVLRNPVVDPSDPHRPLAERIRNISAWTGDPRLNQPLTKDLILEIGGPVFQEAVPIYRKYGR